MNKPINIIIADDHLMVREGIKQLLELDGDIVVNGEASDGKQCVEILNRRHTDVLLLDINMPNMNGLQVLKYLRDQRKNIKVLILTIHNEVEYLVRAVELGVDGYVLKDSESSVLKKAIYCVYRGETFIQPDLTPMLKEKLEERLAKLVGGVAVISVGAATETEMKEKKLRIEDALAATRAAVEEGIVPGGGSALIYATHKVAKLLDTVTGDEKTGVQIILKALEEPVKQIAANAGLEGSVIVDKVRSSEAGIGFDAYNEKYVNMIDAGIVDPTKVTRSAVQNAASAAGMILTTESVVADIPEKEPAAPAMPGGGMGGMY